MSGSEDGAIVMWDVKSKDVVQRLEGEHKGPVLGVDVNAGGMGNGKNMLASCGMDGKIVMWRAEEEEMDGGGEYTNGNINGDDMEGEYRNGHLGEDVPEEYHDANDVLDTPTADTPQVKEEDVGDDLMGIQTG